MTNILIDTETRTWTTRARDESDGWDNGDTAGEVSNVTARITGREPTDYGYDSKVVDLPAEPGDTIFAVVADYESGSTFGRSGGYAAVVDAFTSKEKAYELAEEASSKTGGYEFSFEGRDYYRSWKGYFESLNSMDVWELTVGGADLNGRTVFDIPANSRVGSKRGN